MDKIFFTLGECYDVMEDNQELFDEKMDMFTTEIDGNTCLTVYNYRIVFPTLHISFREGTWYTTEDAIEENTTVYDLQWNIQADVYVRYEENETNINKYISFNTDSIYYLLSEVCSELDISYDNLDELQAYIIFDEKENNTVT